MRKRRNLAKKLCKVSLVFALAISAFFYIPMDVEASTVVSTPSVTVTGPTRYTASTVRIWEDYPVCEIVLPTDLVDGNNYVFTVDLSLTSSFSKTLADNMEKYAYWCVTNSAGETLSTVVSGFGTVVDDNASFVINNYSSSETYSLSFIAYMRTTSTGGQTYTTTMTVNKFDITSYSIAPIEPVESGDFNDGYTAGFADGEESGYSTGYSDGFSSGYDSGEESGYNSGFQSGVDSVDTQSYYNQGYEVGYAKGLAESYETGYNDGYADAMSRIESWGADSTEYPVLVKSGETGNMAFYFGHLDGAFVRERLWTFYYLSDPSLYDVNHNYRISISNIVLDLSNYLNVSLNSIIGINVGGSFYLFDDVKDTNIFLKGTDLSSLTFVFKVSGYGDGISSYFEPDVSFDFSIYDLGPSGDTQNHIANQTDQLTNGFDSSSGQESASQFADGVIEYETAENSIFTSAQSGLADYEFFDFQSVPAVATGLSFVASIMTGIFNSMGGASGAGIVLSVLFSVMLVSIVIGTYKYFQSSGRTGGSRGKKG